MKTQNLKRGRRNGDNAEAGNRNAEWMTVRLGDVVEINPRRMVDEMTDNTVISFVPMASVCEIRKAIIKADHRPFSEVKKGYTPMQNGDVIVAKITPCFENGKMAMLDVRTEYAFGSTEFHVFRGTGKVDQRLIYHLLRSQQILSTGRSHMKGAAGQKRVPADFFRVFEFRVPRSIVEQKRIAAILDKADAIRRKRRQALQLTDDFLRSLFLDMFGDPVTNPKGWDVKPLGGICDVRDGTHDSPRYVDEGRYLLTSKNFKDGMISYEGASMISQSDFDAINKRSKVDAGDIVMPMIGTIGNPIIVRNEPDFAIKNVALIKFSEESPSNYYIKALLCSHYFDHITQKSNRGGTQKFLSLGDIRSIPVPIPDEFEETRFQAITRRTQETLEKLEETSTGTLFASLQQRAFKGEL